MHSWTPHLRRLSLGLVALAVAGVAHADLGDSTSSAACCQLTTSLVNDVIRGKDSSGDERFFSSEGAPPNIHFLVDLSGSMRELPQVINSQHTEFFALTTNGCDNPRLDAFEASRNWDPNNVYPVPDQGTQIGSDTGFSNLFLDDKLYAYMYWGASSSPSAQWNTKEDACKSWFPNWATTDSVGYQQCVDCLQNKGYWKLNGAQGNNNSPATKTFIFTGRFLNFDPPKYVTAKAVLKSVIKDLKRVRVGISVFTGGGFLTDLALSQAPACSAIANDASAFDNFRETYIATVNGWDFQTGTPLAKSLLNVGYYFTSGKSVYQTDFNFGNNYTYNSNPFTNKPLTDDNRSVCWGCQTNSVIIITDGEPSGDNFSSTMADRLRTLNGGPTYCPDSAPCNSGATNFTRDKGNNEGIFTDDNPAFYLDDVAKMLYHQDLQKSSPSQVGDFNTAGQQSVITYTVGFGVNSNLLKNTADVGGGSYYTADDGATLKQAILDIINNVQTRATSFSSSATATLQVHGESSVLIPRFKPARAKTEPWQGFLYRFNLSDERTQNCIPGGVGDINNDGDCQDTILVDKNNQPIVENDDGDFVLVNSPTTLATPFWEAGKVLKDDPDAATTAWQDRHIYTIIDSNGDGKVDFRDTPVEFTEANSGVLREYLGISQNPLGCSDLAAKLGVPSLTPDECTKLVIRWYRGANALASDPADRDYDRSFLLGDLFHSSPISVDPPSTTNFCAFSNQCLQTLFSGATERQNDYTTPTNTGVDAYDKYVYEAGDRDQVILVGGNDGMLHAFANGVSTGDEDQFTHQLKHDQGTGKELWAFIPPDMLPKLRPNIGKHAYFVDGSPMVRDVWVDGSEGQPSDGKKQWQEYRTVAVLGTGRGGVHHFALDMTRLLGRTPHASESVYPNQPGDFLWMWPQPCDPLALQVGESFSNFAPRAPPMGPVALTSGADDALRTLYGGTAGSAASPWFNNTARERYVAFLNGGYDQTMTRGRGMAMVDLSTGHTLWSFFYGDSTKGRSQYLRYPIGGGVSMVDIGKADTAARDSDYLFDTATVGDYGGQLWTVRFYNPGEWDPATKQIDNWVAARSFRVANLEGKSVDPEAMRAPFSYMTLNTYQPGTGFLRTYIGTGDRENLMDKGTVCRLSTPRACAVQGCGTSSTITVKRGGTTVFSTNATYANYHYGSSAVATASGGNSCESAEVTLAWDNTAANGCGNGNDGTIQYACSGNSATWSCGETANDWTALNYPAASPYPQRYYGLWTYGGMDATRRFNNDSEADTYESHMPTDTDLTNVSQFDASTGLVVESTQQSADPGGKGWYLQYSAANERTASSGALTSGCVLWTSFEPSGSAGAVCATTGTNLARLYQANFSTGMADCALGFYEADNSGNGHWKRFIQSSTVVAIGDPAFQVGIGGGTINTGIVTMPAGAPPTGITLRQSDEAVKSFYQLELDSRGHNCRHNGQNCK